MCFSRPATRSRWARASWSTTLAAAPFPLPIYATQISMIIRPEMELSSAIIKTIGETEGSRILSHPVKSDLPLPACQPGHHLRSHSGCQAHPRSQPAAGPDPGTDLPRLDANPPAHPAARLAACRGCSRRASQEPPRSEEFEPRGACVAGQRQPPGKDLGEPSHHGPGPAAEAGHAGVRPRPATIALTRSRASSATASARSSASRCAAGMRRWAFLYLDSLTPRRDPVASLLPVGKFNADHGSPWPSPWLTRLPSPSRRTRYYQALLQAERLAAVGQTVAALSHHIKNILQGPVGASSQFMNFLCKSTRWPRSEVMALRAAAHGRFGTAPGERSR